MSDLFSASGMADEAPRPLADRLRPQTLSEVVKHVADLRGEHL